LECASDELKNDRGVVLAAVSNYGRALECALEYASDELKNDREIVLKAVGNKGFALRYASDELKNDREVVLAAVGNKGYALRFALRYASDELKNDREIVLEAVGNKGYALRFASDELKKDREVVLAAVNNDGRALEYASEKFRNDPSVVARSVVSSWRPYVGFRSAWIGDELKSQLVQCLQWLKLECGYCAKPGPLSSNADLLDYAKQRERILWEIVWLVTSEAPDVGIGVKFPRDIRKHIWGFAGASGELTSLGTLAHCAPVIGAFAEKGVGWGDIDLDQDYIQLF